MLLKVENCRDHLAAQVDRTNKVKNMNRKIFILVSLGASAMICIILILGHFTANPFLEQLRSNSDTIKADCGVSHDMDLGKCTPFPWTKAYFFSPYTSTEEIRTTAGVKIENNITQYLSAHDSHCLVIFLNNQVVEKSILVSRDIIDFSKYGNPPIPILNENAIMKIECTINQYGTRWLTALPAKEGD